MLAQVSHMLNIETIQVVGVRFVKQAVKITVLVIINEIMGGLKVLKLLKDCQKSTIRCNSQDKQQWVRA